MERVKHLLQRNKEWAAAISNRDGTFFERLSKQQLPKYLWIGCSDSRVPANQIVDLQPGELFVHRNIGNVVVHTDLNCLSVIQFAVEILGVRDIIVCGHYGCAGVRATLLEEPVGLAENWLRHVKDVHDKHASVLGDLDQESRLNRLCELNVVEQVRNVAQTSIVKGAWARGQELSIHGWIYGLHDGILRDLEVTRGPG